MAARAAVGASGPPARPGRTRPTPRGPAAADRARAAPVPPPPRRSRPASRAAGARPPAAGGSSRVRRRRCRGGVGWYVRRHGSVSHRGRGTWMKPRVCFTFQEFAIFRSADNPHFGGPRGGVSKANAFDVRTSPDDQAAGHSIREPRWRFAAYSHPIPSLSPSRRCGSDPMTRTGAMPRARMWPQSTSGGYGGTQPPE